MAFLIHAVTFSDYLNKMNHKIKILTSSQRRDLHIFLRPLFPEYYNIDVVFKPSATFAGVIENLHEIVQSLTPNDYLVIMGGSNDILSGETGNTFTIFQQMNLSVI